MRYCHRCSSIDTTDEAVVLRGDVCDRRVEHATTDVSKACAIEGKLNCSLAAHIRRR